MIKHTGEFSFSKTNPSKAGDWLGGEESNLAGQHPESSLAFSVFLKP